MLKITRRCRERVVGGRDSRLRSFSQRSDRINLSSVSNEPEVHRSLSLCFCVQITGFVRFQETTGQWVGLDLELEMRGAEIVGTKKPSGHSLLIDCRLELPYGK